MPASVAPGHSQSPKNPTFRHIVSAYCFQRENQKSKPPFYHFKILIEYIHVAMVLINEPGRVSYNTPRRVHLPP